MTVLWAAGLLTLPPIVAGGRAVTKGDTPAEAAVCGLLGLAVAAGLVGGWRGGYFTALLLAAVATVGGGLLLLFGTLAGPIGPTSLPYLFIPLVLGLNLVGLLRWPETRRWCGLLPPRDPDTGE